MGIIIVLWPWQMFGGMLFNGMTKSLAFVVSNSLPLSCTLAYALYGWLCRYVLLCRWAAIPDLELQSAGDQGAFLFGWITFSIWMDAVFCWCG